MISRADIVERVKEWQLTEEVMEKDYVLGWLLWGLGSDPDGSVDLEELPPLPRGEGEQDWSPPPP